MADIPFDREILNPLERPLADDINLVETYTERALREFVDRLTAPRSSNTDASGTIPPASFVGDGFWVRPGGGMSVNVSKGLGFFADAVDLPTAIGGIVGVDDHQRYKPLVMSAAQNLAVPAAPAGPNSRIDIIEVKVRRALIDLTGRDLFDPGSGNFIAGLVDKTLTWDLFGQTGVVTDPANNTSPLGYKIGIPGNPPAVPPTSPGYVKISEVRIPSAPVAAITDAHLGDFRQIYSPHGYYQCSFRISIPFPGGYGAGFYLPTLSNVKTPAGVRLAVVGEDVLLTRSFYIYILTQMSSFDWQYQLVNAGTSGATSFVTSMGVATGAIGTIASSDAVTLASAGAAPNTLVAVGAPCLKMFLVPRGCQGAFSWGQTPADLPNPGVFDFSFNIKI